MIVSGKNDFKAQDGKIIFTGKYMEVYIDQYYFDKRAASIIGTHFKTLGILNFRTFADIDGKKPGKLRTLNLPIEIVTYPSGGFEEKELDLIGKGARRYHVLKYFNGDELCSETNPVSIPTFTLCLNIILSGHLPATIPYDSVIDIWQNSFDMNNVSFDVPDVTKEMIIAQIYRDPKDASRTYGSTLAKNPQGSMYNYEQANQRKLAASQSVFNGLVFENFDQMLTSGIITTKHEKKQNISPMEQVMKF